MAEPAPYCNHCDLPLAMCIHGRVPVTRRALGQAREVPVDWDHMADLAEQGMTAETGPLFEALYHGTCRGCGGRWSPGDFIAWATGEDRPVCADCARGYDG
jgi:hypothetical protein